jgi:glycolate oxidase FAD binding subunit
MAIAPADEAELAETIASAGEPLHIRGGGTRSARADGTVLSTAKLQGITLYEPGALTLVARTGTPLAEIEAALSAERQRLAFEPMDHRGLLGTTGAPTIGGVVAANVSGPRRVQVGACRDHLLGVRFVDGHGQALKNGGRVMKNVTGYDLVKLMAGSHGTLGVLTEVSLKVLPEPEITRTLSIEGLPDAEAVRAMSKALTSPYEVTGAAHVRGGRTLLRLEGFVGSVAYRASRLQRELRDFGDWTFDDRDDPWEAIRDVAPFHGRRGDVWRFSVKPSDAPEIAARLDAEAVVYDWGGGLIWVLMPEGTDARALAALFAGHATLVRGAAALPRFHPEPAPVAALSAALRRQFDPRGILNPGMMG